MRRAVTGKVVELDCSRRFLQAIAYCFQRFAPSLPPLPKLLGSPSLDHQRHRRRRRLLSHLRTYMRTSRRRSRLYVFYAFSIPSHSPPHTLSATDHICEHRSTRGWWRCGTAEGGEGQAKGMRRCSQHETMEEHGQTGHFVHSQTFPCARH